MVPGPRLPRPRMGQSTRRSRPQRPRRRQHIEVGRVERADLPGALEHAGRRRRVRRRAHRRRRRSRRERRDALRGRDRGRGGGRGRSHRGRTAGGRRLRARCGPTASAPSRPRARRSAKATARSAFCAPAGRSCSAFSGPTAATSFRPRPSSSASSRSPAPTSGWPTTRQGNRRIHPLTSDDLRWPNRGCERSECLPIRSASSVARVRSTPTRSSRPLICLISDVRRSSVRRSRKRLPYPLTERVRN